MWLPSLKVPPGTSNRWSPRHSAPLPLTDLPLRAPHLRSLLPPQRDLRGHDALPLHHQQAAGAAAVPPAAQPFVALQTRDDAVVPTAGAFRTAGRLVRALLLPALWRRGHSVRSSGPRGSAEPRERSVRTCNVNNVFSCWSMKFLCGLRLQASFRLSGHLWLVAESAYKSELQFVVPEAADF